MHSFLSPHFDGFWCLHICATTTSRQNISTSPEHSAAVPFSANVWRIWPATLVVGLGRIYRNLEWAGELWVWMSLWMMESCSVWGPGLLLMQGWLCAWVLPKKSLPLRHCSLQEGPDSSPFFLKLLLFQGHNANGQGTLFSREQMPAGRQIPQGLLGKCGSEFCSINPLFIEHLPYAWLCPENTKD